MRKPLDELNADLMAERAAALARTASVLESHLAEAVRLEGELATAPVALRPALVERLSHAREEALRYRLTGGGAGVKGRP